MTRDELLALARKKGTDKQFRRWVNEQPSCISGQFSEWHDGIGYCEAAHVRLVKWGAGMGKKNEYACVPLTRSEHREQHQRGYEYFAPMDWWEEQSLKYLRLWINS